MTETVTLPARQALNLNLASLNSVMFVTEHPVTKGVTSYASERLEKAKQWRAVSAISQAVQFQALLTWTLFHSVPWPTAVISGVHTVDDTVHPYLEGASDKATGFVEYTTTTFSGAVEKTLGYASSGISFVDSVIAFVRSKVQFMSEHIEWVLNLSKTAFEWTSAVVSNVWETCKHLVDTLQSKLGADEKVSLVCRRASRRLGRRPSGLKNRQTTYPLSSPGSDAAKSPLSSSDEANKEDELSLWRASVHHANMARRGSDRPVSLLSIDAADNWPEEPMSGGSVISDGCQDDELLSGLEDL